MALDVSGPIVSDTTWALADSPFNVVADVEIDAGAQLTIEPGVHVRFAADTRLVVQIGAVRAVGSVAAPIIFDSALASAAAGDWGPILIEDHSRDATTAWDFVVVRHGKGVALHRASPTLNRVTLENNAGAAMSLDLESSPIGVGLSATGNDLNGISIPPGTITGSVRWGLIGIPYVVTEGIVTIGLPPMTLTPTTLNLREGQQATLTLQLAKPAPAGGLTLDVVSSAPNVASVASALTLPAGTLQTTFSVGALTAGATTVTVSRLELGAVSAAVTVQPPIALSFAPAAATLAVGQSATLSVQLSEPAPAGGVTIALSSSNPAAVTVPTSRFVAAGFSSASFSAQGIALGTSTLTASAPGSVSATASVQVRNAFLSFSPVGVLQPHTTQSLTINVSEPAPAAGLSIALASSQSNVISVPSTVFVAAGESSASVSVQAGNEGAANLSASKLGYEPASISVLVQLIQLSFDPATGTAQIPVGSSDHFVARLNRPAIAGGLTVSLSSSAPAAVGVTPNEIFIPEGQTASLTPVEVTGLQVMGSGTVRAESPGVTSGALNVVVDSAAALQFEPAVIVIGRDTRASVQITRRLANGNFYQDRDPLRIGLASSAPLRLDVPGSIEIPAGQSSIYLPLTATAATLTSEPTMVTASAPGITSTAIEVSIADPIIDFQLLDQTRAVGSVRDDFYLYLTAHGSTASIQAVRDLVVDLSIAESSPPDLVSGLFDSASGGGSLLQMTIPAGRSYSADSMGNLRHGFVATPSLAGSYRVTAQIGAHTPSLSAIQTVGDSPGLAFSRTQLRLARGMQSNSVAIYRTVDGNPFYGVAAATVAVNLSEPGKVGAPVTVDIPAGSDQVILPLVGLELTSNPVIVEADSAGYAAPSEHLNAIVESAAANLYLNTEQLVGGERNSLTVSWEDNPKGDQLISPVDRPVTVTLSDLNPLGIVDGFYAGFVGTEPLGPLTLRAGEYQLTDAQGEPAVIYVGSPTAPGSYRVNVDVPGFGNWNSELVTVTEVDPVPLSLSFSHESHVIGRGLRALDVRVHRTGGNVEQSLTVELSSAEPGNVSVPAEVVIPSGADNVVVPLTGMALSAAPVAISAQAQGNPALTASMLTYVVNPMISFRRLREQRSLGSERDGFSVLWSVPVSTEPQQVSQTDTTVTLNIVDNPIGMIPALYAGPAGATTRSMLVIGAGESESLTANGDSDQLYVGTPTTTGSYRVYAAVAGLSDSPSNLVTVSRPALRFTRATHDVGLGLRASAVRLVRTVSVSGAIEPAPEDLVISLSCAAGNVCQVPATVTLPAGETEIVIPISGVGLGSTRLTATAPGYAPGVQPDVDVRVVRPRLQLAGIPNFLRVGQTAMVLAQLDVPSSTESSQTAIAPISVVLTSSFPGAASISPLVGIPAGSNQSGEASLTALAPGVTTLTPSAPSGDSVSSDVWIVE